MEEARRRNQSLGIISSAGRSSTPTALPNFHRRDNAVTSCVHGEVSDTGMHDHSLTSEGLTIDAAREQGCDIWSPYMVASRCGTSAVEMKLSRYPRRPHHHRSLALRLMPSRNDHRWSRASSKLPAHHPRPHSCLSLETPRIYTKTRLRRSPRCLHRTAR